MVVANPQITQVKRQLIRWRPCPRDSWCNCWFSTDGHIDGMVDSTCAAESGRVPRVSARPAAPGDERAAAGQASTQLRTREACTNADKSGPTSPDCGRPAQPVPVGTVRGPPPTTLDLARAARVKAVVYLSVIHADVFTEPPHLAAKAAAERMIEDFGIQAPCCGPASTCKTTSPCVTSCSARVCTVRPWAAVRCCSPTRDLAEVAARELLRRVAAPDAPAATIDVVAPQVLSGDRIAAIWSSVLGREIRSAVGGRAGATSHLYLSARIRLSHGLACLLIPGRMS